MGGDISGDIKSLGLQNIQPPAGQAKSGFVSGMFKGLKDSVMNPVNNTDRSIACAKKNIDDLKEKFSLGNFGKVVWNVPMAALHVVTLPVGMALGPVFFTDHLAQSACRFIQQKSLDVIGAQLLKQEVYANTAASFMSGEKLKSMLGSGKVDDAAKEIITDELNARVLQHSQTLPEARREAAFYMSREKLESMLGSGKVDDAAKEIITDELNARVLENLNSTDEDRIEALSRISTEMLEHLSSKGCMAGPNVKVMIDEELSRR